MPTYLVVVTERRTHEIEADTEAAAIERAGGDPADLPIGSLVSTVRSRPEIVQTAESEADEGTPPHEGDAGRPDPPDFDLTLLNQPWG